MNLRFLSFTIAACALLLASRGGADDDAGTCTREALHAFRTTTIHELFDGKRYGEAADMLARYIDERNCYGELEPELRLGEETLGKEAIADGEELLWAYSDLALAYLRSDRPGSCLEVVETRMKEYYSNVLEEVGSEKLKKAFSTNKALCEARRAELFPRVPERPCESLDLPKRAPQTLIGESELDLEIESTPGAIRVDPATGFDCIAVLSLKTMKGLLDGLCETRDECRRDPESGYGDETSIRAVYGIKGGSPAELVQLDYTDGSGACGLPEISLHRHALKPSEHVLRVSSHVSPCVTGTARGEIDSYFRLSGGRMTPLDPSVRWYH